MATNCSCQWLERVLKPEFEGNTMRQHRFRKRPQQDSIGTAWAAKVHWSSNRPLPLVASPVSRKKLQLSLANLFLCIGICIVLHAPQYMHELPLSWPVACAAAT